MAPARTSPALPSVIFQTTQQCILTSKLLASLLIATQLNNEFLVIAAEIMHPAE